MGVCGKTVTLDGGIENFSNVGSLCIRLPREATGCATEVAKAVLEPRLKSLLIVSPPRLGKTTMLRDLARILSDAGCNIAIADERREIAACVNGIPTMNVGQRSDVMDGCAKAISIPLLIRSCAPDVLIADEIGTQADAEALLDAARCGVKIIASAHGDGYREIARRRNIAPLLEGHAFDLWALLGPTAGKLKHLGKCEDMGC